MDIEHSLNDTVLEKFNCLISKHFPYLQSRSTGYTGMTFDYELPHKFSSFMRSPYYFQDELEFAHWTSIPNLISIINNREFRMYNLHNSNDKEEFEFGALTMDIEPKEIEHLKNYYYSLSFCEKKDLYNPVLWEEYGNNYSGVAIEFTLENNLSEWEKFMISKVYYDLPPNFEKLKMDLQLLKEEYHASFKLNFGKILGFHKQNSFEREKEIRIATFFPYKYNNEYLHHTRTDFRIDGVRNRITNYIPLPIFVDNESPFVKSRDLEYDRRSKFDSVYFAKRPLLKIKKIHVGHNCGIALTEFEKFRNALLIMARHSLGYEIMIDNCFFDVVII